jgi:hypothetical protein
MDDRLSAVFYTTVYIISIALICSRCRPPPALCTPETLNPYPRSIWSKMLSHEIIGYYAWFWGDFFFKIDKVTPSLPPLPPLPPPSLHSLLRAHVCISDAQV